MRPIIHRSACSCYECSVPGVAARKLIRDLGAYWQHIGSIELIGGRDLASENLKPHEFLDFVLGKLTRQFVRDVWDLSSRLTQVDLLPDGDGRFRGNEFLCHDNTWKPTLNALVQGVDVILIDLRGLSPERRGVQYEIQQLAALGLLGRVVALVDDTTHQPFLRDTLNRLAVPAIRSVLVRGRRASTAELLDQLEVVARAGAAG
jgi:hypothetical protein